MQTSVLHWKGYAYLVGWCLISAYSMLTTSEVNQTIDPFVLCFFSFSITSALFLLANIDRLPTIVKRLYSTQTGADAIWINLTTLLAWVLLVYPLKFIQPTAVVTITLGVNPIATLLIEVLFFRRKLSSKISLALSFGMVISVAFVCGLCLYGVNTLGDASKQDIAISLGCCVISGAATAANNILIKRLFAAKFTPLEILSFRFVLTVLASAIVVKLWNIPFVYTGETIRGIAVTTILFLVTPLILIQLALRALEPIHVALVSPIMPMVVATFQLLFIDAQLPTVTVFGAAVVWLLVFGGNLVAHIKQIRRI